MVGAFAVGAGLAIDVAGRIIIDLCIFKGSADRLAYRHPIIPIPWVVFCIRQTVNRYFNLILKTNKKSNRPADN